MMTFLNATSSHLMDIWHRSKSTHEFNKFNTSDEITGKYKLFRQRDKCADSLLGINWSILCSSWIVIFKGIRVDCNGPKFIQKTFLTVSTFEVYEMYYKKDN